MVTRHLNKHESVEIVLVNEPSDEWRYTQDACSTLRIFLIDLQDKADAAADKHYSLHIEQLGEECRTEIYSLAYLCGSSKTFIETDIHHTAGKGVSKQLVKFVLSDQSHGEFLGAVSIAPNAQKVETDQTNRNLLLSTEAEMRSRPQLEIYADDVHASHGASTGQIDEQALFYMQQRGISFTLARKILISAFLKEVLEGMSDVNQREALMETIDRVVQ